MRQQGALPSNTALFEIVAAQAALMGAPARLKILLLLSQAHRTVESLADQTVESVANVSQHLKKLRAGGLVTVEKSGVSRIYRLSDERIGLVLEDLFDLAEIQDPGYPALQKKIGADDEWSPLSQKQLRRELRDEKAILLDVRESGESSVTPVPNAIAIPLDELKGRIRELSRLKIYFIFCRGRACARATEGVRLLREKGLRAFRLKDSPSSLRFDRESLLRTD